MSSRSVVVMIRKNPPQTVMLLAGPARILRARKPPAPENVGLYGENRTSED